MDYEVKEKGELCSCGGEIDSLYLTDSNPDIWAGKCFRCGSPFTIIFCKRLNN